MTPKKSDQGADSGELPFGALPKGDVATSKPVRRKKKAAKKVSKKKAVRRSADDGAEGEAPTAAPAEAAGDTSGEAGGDGRRKRSRRGRRRKRRGEDGDEPRENHDDVEAGATADRPAASENDGGEGEGGTRRKRRRRRRRNKTGAPNPGAQNPGAQNPGAQNGATAEGDGSDDDGPKEAGGQERRGPKGGKSVVEGMFFLEKGQVSVLRHEDQQWMPSKQDVYVPKNLVQKFKLHDGMIVKGPTSKGYKHKHQLQTVTEIDGQPPEFWKKKPFFKNLTSIDPDFHYAVGDITDDVSMRVLDLIAPIGRGQRGLLVAPPRTGKTTLLRQFAKGIEEGYPDVHLMVLLIDERPEEATDWRRSVTNGKVFVSTADETAKNHINLAEVVWRRAMRLVEMGEDVVLLLDSITRLARAYNNQAGPGRTMSGGLDSRAMERPRKFFGSARNTVEAGSLTILGTTLVETGSRMDQLVFEEFKGTGNMELMLNRKLSDRRIFPSIDIEKSGTRKEEKLVGMRRLKLIHVLRRVLARMHFAEAAELLITRLDDVEKTDDFLERFTVDPEA
ncbi:MAG: transcription termination factor Rho [Planctomycetota bacterium]